MNASPLKRQRNRHPSNRNAAWVEHLEDRRLLSADLTPNFSGSLPAVLMSGASAKATVRVANVGDVRASGAAQVTVYASADGVLDAADVPLGESVRALKVKPGKSTSVKLTLRPPADLPSGDYTLLAHVDTGSSAIQDGNPANDLAAAPTLLAVRQPVVDLSPRFVALPVAPLEAFRGGWGDSVIVEVSNTGNSAVRAGFEVDVYLSTDATLDGADVLLGIGSVRRSTTIKPGTFRDVTVPLGPPPEGTPAGRYHLIAEVDPLDAVAEADETNNLALSPSQVPVVTTPPPPVDRPGYVDGYYWTEGPYVETYYYYDDGAWFFTDEVIEVVEVIEVPPDDPGYYYEPEPPPPDDYYYEEPIVGEWPWDEYEAMPPAPLPPDQREPAPPPPTSQPAPEPWPEPAPAPPAPEPTPEPGIWDQYPAPGEDYGYYDEYYYYE